jgi:RluA family pseudouridine synthase
MSKVTDRMSVFNDEIREFQREKMEPKMPEPIIIGPLRFFPPYDFTFKTISKGRWYGRVLLDVFAEEFKHVGYDVLKQRIIDGKITVNGKSISPEYVIREHDSIKHVAPRYESPTYNLPIEKLGDTEDFIAVFKPASLPIHATGGYFFNSLVKQVGTRYFPVHRLDRVTSGIIVMAKTEQAAKRFAQLLNAEKIRKTYVARVLGKFPEGETVVDAPIRESKDSRAKRTCGEGGKESKTVFKFLQTNGRESIVECHPITGRTHQIRVHLAHLGFPISNDSFYGGTEAGITKEEENALVEAKERGLLAPEIEAEWKNREIAFQIYLCSTHYASDLFDFSAPMPKWAKLD